VSERFPLAAAADRAWALIEDIRGVFACLASAELGPPSDGRYPAVMKVRLAGVNLAFRGTVELLLDPAGKTATLHARGADFTGAIKARSEVQVSILADAGAGCTLEVWSRTEMLGGLANVMAGPGAHITRQILKDFGDCIASRAAA